MINLDQLCEKARLQEAVASGKEDYETDLKNYLMEKHNFHLFEYFINNSGDEDSKSVHPKSPLFKPLHGGERGYLFLAGLPGQCYPYPPKGKREGTFYLVLQDAESAREFHKIIRHLTTDPPTKSFMLSFIGGAAIGGAALMGADLAFGDANSSGEQLAVASDAILGAVLGATGGLGTLVGKNYFCAKRDTSRLMEFYRPLMKHSSVPYDADFLKSSVL